MLAQSVGRPYKLRKNFEGFEDNKNYPYVRKISNMFKSCPHISLDDYFIAPYKVYELDEGQSYTLQFYASMKALGCYKQYMVIKELSNPDEEHQLDFIQRSFRFIGKFCYDNKITSFDDYITCKKGFTPEWMKHYAEKKISLLCLLESDNIFDIIMGIEEEHRSLLLGDLEHRFYKIKGEYLRSSKAKVIVKNTINKLNKILIKTSLEDKEKKENGK
jgi:hypothetical protein